MEFIKFILTSSSKMLLSFAITIGLLNGGISTLVLWNINSAITGNQQPQMFLLLLIGSVLTYLLSTYLIELLFQKNLYSVRVRIVSMILNSEYREIELHGKARLLTLLTQDVGSIVGAISFIPRAIIDSSILVSCSIYLAIISPYIFFALLVTLIVGVAVYFIINKPAYNLFKKNRSFHEVLLQYYNEIIYAGREYKHCTKIKKTNYKDNFIASLDNIKHTHVKAQFLFSLGEAWGRLMLFILLGGIVYLFPKYLSVLEITSESLAISVTVIIFSLGSIYSLVDIFPLFSRASISYKKIKTISIKNEKQKHSNKLINLPCDAIQYSNIEYTYFDKSKKKLFHIGPISLTINRGEIVFISGGNGSGKTTLLKVLTGIYPIDAGSIICAGQEIIKEDRKEFRKLFSVIWNDNYLFDGLLNKITPDKKKDVDYWLDRLNIGNKIITSKQGEQKHSVLSSGQNKRLLLVFAFLQNHEFIVLDEWAAEQSPDYKEKFYRELLPELKSKGIGVLVVSHDSNYFDIADRIFTMDNGQLSGVVDN